MEKTNRLEDKFLYKKETIDGKVIYTQPRTEHSDIVISIYDIFKEYFRISGNTKCLVYPDNLFLYLKNGSKLIPDVMVICDVSKKTKRGFEGVPELVVEVLSRTTYDYDLTRKKEIYEELGVKEYWIVDPSFKGVSKYILEDGKYSLNGVFFKKDEEDDVDENVDLKYSFNTFVFPDLEIRLDEVFKQ
ncbi:MAG: Uma2 family endonuclease [Oscillospiraceae bacterium]|nr:Uma2 family endonuclease [Oscillospiraceae bacterium]